MEEAERPSSSKVMRDTLKELKRTEYGLLARLRSIRQDAKFVHALHQRSFAGLPLFGNLRNGAWYVPPQANRTFYCTFKSGDGHSGKVDFSARRLNLHLLRTTSAGPSYGLPSNCTNGAAIVDSTRQGKRFPDSMTRTIPFWCMVLNFICFHERENLFPPWVSSQEAQDLVQAVEQHASKLPPEAVTSVKEALSYPLRPMWVSPVEHCDCSSDDYTHWDRQVETCLSAGLTFAQAEDVPGGLSLYTPIVLVSASVLQREDLDRPYRSWRYIQGAGDDEEFWSQGLSHTDFWANEDKFASCETNEDCLNVIKSLQLNNDASPCVNEECVKPLLGVALFQVESTVRIEHLAQVAAGWPMIDVRRNDQEKQGDEQHLFVDIPSGKGQSKLRGPWQALLKKTESFVEKHGYRTAIVTDKENEEAAKAIAVAVVLLKQIEDGEIALDKFEKTLVNNALFTLSKDCPWLENLQFARKLLKELIVFFFDKKKTASM